MSFWGGAARGAQFAQMSTDIIMDSTKLVVANDCEVQRLFLATYSFDFPVGDQSTPV